MTRDEIVNMPAGREMDALVAEKVMGEPKPIYVHPNLHIEYPKESTLGNWRCYNIYEHGDVCEWNPLPFSTDIASAWEVVEKLCNKYHVSIWTDFTHYGTALRTLGIDELVEVTAAPTAPLAICRAALLAVMDTTSVTNSVTNARDDN